MLKKIIIGFFLLSGISFSYLLPRFQVTAYGLTKNDSHSSGELEGVIPLLYNDTSIFFTDFRGLGYVNGASEGSMAIGWRHVYKNMVIGLHGGLDIRKSEETTNYFQEGTIGGELWRGSWYIGLNGYIPYGIKKKNYTNYKDKAENNLYKTIGATDFVEAVFTGSDLWVGYNINPKIDVYGRGFYFTDPNFKAFTGGALRAEYKIYGKGEQKALWGWINHIGVFLEGKYDTYNDLTGLGGLKVSLYDPNQKDTKHFLEPITRDMDAIIGKKQTSPTVNVLSLDGTEIHIYDVHNADELKMAKNHEDANVIALHGDFDVDKAGEAADLNRNVTLTGGNYVYKGSDGKSHALKVSDGATITFSKVQPLFDVSSNVHNVVIRDLTVYNAGDIFSPGSWSPGHKSDIPQSGNATTSQSILNNINRNGGKITSSPYLTYIHDHLYGTFNVHFFASNSGIIIQNSVIETNKPLSFEVSGSNFLLKIENTTFNSGGGIYVDTLGSPSNVTVDIQHSTFNFSNPTTLVMSNKLKSTQINGVSKINGIQLSVGGGNTTFIFNDNTFNGIVNSSFIGINGIIGEQEYSGLTNQTTGTFNITMQKNTITNGNVVIASYIDNTANSAAKASGSTYTYNMNVILDGNTILGTNPLAILQNTEGYANAVMHTTVHMTNNKITMDWTTLKNNVGLFGTAIGIFTYGKKTATSDLTLNLDASDNTIIIKNFTTPLGSEVSFSTAYTEGAKLNLNFTHNTFISHLIPMASNNFSDSSINIGLPENSNGSELNFTFKKNTITIPVSQYNVTGGTEPYDANAEYPLYQMFFDGNGNNSKEFNPNGSGASFYTNGYINAIKGQAGFETLKRTTGSGKNIYKNAN